MVYKLDDPARFRVVVLSPEELAAEVAVINAQRAARYQWAASQMSMSGDPIAWVHANRYLSRVTTANYGGPDGLEAAAAEAEAWTKANPGWEKRTMGRERQAWKPRMAGKRKPAAA